MKGRYALLAVVGVLALTTALVIRAPAEWALHLARERLPGDLAWRGASGTAFDATIRELSIRFGEDRRIRLDRVELQTSLARLLVGHVDIDFRVRGYEGELSGRADFDLTGWEVPLVEGGLSLKLLPDLFPGLEAAGMDGYMAVRGAGLGGNYEGTGLSGVVDATVLKLRVGLVEALHPLGDYALRIETRPDRLIGDVQTVSRDALLGIQGDFRFEPVRGRLHFDGLAWAADDATTPIHRVLPLLGPVRDGHARINWQTTL